MIQTENWIETDIEEYKQIILKNRDKEIALCHYALNMIKILNGLSEIGMTDFYEYEREILWDAIKLFSNHCKEQIVYALNCNVVREKKRIIIDIEDSIVQIMDVCKTIFQGTASAERKMFQNTLVDKNLFELSPKLCALYSGILKKVVQLFADGEYAFVIYPTLRSTTEAKTLLKTRTKPGKVVIVCISENNIDLFSSMPICLVHEAFHVITREERLRKKRAAYLAVNLIEYMELFLFHKVEFPEKEKGQEIKKNLITYWFDDVKSMMKHWSARANDDKLFYSENIEEELINKIKKCLANINVNLENDMLECSYDIYKTDGYAIFRRDMLQLKEITNQIRDNTNQIIFGNLTSQVVYLLMFLYRETYADIACILTLNLNVDQYKEAFHDSIQLDYNKETFTDITKWAREYLVARTLSRIFPENRAWENYLKELIKTTMKLYKNQPRADKKSENQARQNSTDCDRILSVYLTNATLIQFGNYLDEFAKLFLKRLEKIDNIDDFRQYTRRILTADRDQLLIDILSQKV